MIKIKVRIKTEDTCIVATLTEIQELLQRGNTQLVTSDQNGKKTPEKQVGLTQENETNAQIPLFNMEIVICHNYQVKDNKTMFQLLSWC